MSTNEHSLKKQRVGIVTSNKADKTITVTGNTQPPTTVLLLKGEVVAPPTN